MSAEKTDHKAEALRLLGEASQAALRGHERFQADDLQLAALVHSNLAITEGQERVAEAVEDRADTWFRRALDEIRCLTADQGETNDNKVRERIFRIADAALEQAEL